MGATIGKLSGIALRPSISRNQREYTREAIASAVHHAQQRIADGTKPLTMLSHHAADDDSTRIVGRITAISLDPDGSARYEAELADTEAARTIAALIDPAGGHPYLSGVSIRGAWAAPVKRKMVDGAAVEYADDLELHGLDFTASPGVDGARVDQFTRTSRPRETDDGRPLIFESVEEAVITESAADHAVSGCDGTCCKECGVNATAAQETSRAAWLAEASRNPARHVFKDGRCVTCGY